MSTGQNNIRKNILLIMHFLVIALSIILITVISIDTFQNKSFLADQRYMSIQFGICLFFIFDIIIEWYLADNKWKYLHNHIFFLIVSIPYLNLISYFGINVSCETLYLLRFFPLLRTAYVIFILARTFSRDNISSIFTAYIVTLFVTIYFASLMFFVEEHYINPGVETFWSALWWAFMDATTVGSNISEITTTGKILAVILSIEGLILFPVFTVYVTNAVTKKQS